MYDSGVTGPHLSQFLMSQHTNVPCRRYDLDLKWWTQTREATGDL